MHRLPSRIAAVMTGMILVFVVVLGLFSVWTTRTIDREAGQSALRQVDHGIRDQLESIAAMDLDYAKWDEAANAVTRQDAQWLSDNVGQSAVTGEAFQLAVIWGGPLATDLGWIAGGGEGAQAGLLPRGDLEAAERALAGVPVNSYGGHSYVLRLGQDLYAVSVSRIEALVDDPVGIAPPPPGGQANLLLGLRIDGDVLAHLTEAFDVQNPRLVDAPPQAALSTPLPGPDGSPVGYVAWDEPGLDEKLLRQMIGPGLLAILIVTGLSGLGMTMVRRNAQELVAAELQASRAARTDAMTGLPNRAAFNEVLARSCKAGERAILFLDVNGFKRINDSIGHAAGDAVIVIVAERLSRLTAPGTVLARIAGDEFVFVLTGTDAQPRTEALAQRIEEVLSIPVSVLGHSMRLRMAQGYAVQFEDDMPGEDLVRQADLAMYEAKRNPERGLVAFSAVIAQATQDARTIEQGLRQALLRGGEISIVYQPIVGRDGRLARAEALARWTSPTLGVLPPDRFIAVAEQAGLIVELGRHLFGLICDDLEAHPDLRVAINVSPLQLRAPDFVSSFVGELQKRRIDPSRIEIELTETVVVDDSHLAADRLRELRDAGFSTALDDFGTGYSSIGYLRQMNFHVLKIDRSFAAQIASSPQATAMMRSLIELAHGLYLKVVCEGVESAEDLALVRRLGCDLAQGYYLDKPMPMDAFAERWLSQDIADVAAG
ncbi:bifunctional diguanylate cyclase/phosphodiesterase [Rubellimicrobium rubrum]|uniref:Bifunctional diguanylate cyclase/phosphodiesterase n=1 Tax=Rubellimicrobium rubrum TaxID=2585369 RepID=A0A5C4N5J1_9RHOB|nr:bifunctional diguanylate cyclase/phosphodiesterase [Rubellimicrobium rubrum]TNC51628.1 bifunctional diguanylate cyclase/phosphodiesterase [Rubellimicrobium rubrum]